jgi:MFS family permease
MLAENPVRSMRQEKSKTTTITLKKILSKKRIRVMLTGVMLYGVGYGFFVTSIPAYLISVKRFTSTEIGMYFSLFYITISFVQLTTGPLSDKYGRSGFMIVGLILAFPGMVFFSCFGKTGSMAMLIPASFGLGIFYVASIAHLNETVGGEQKGTISGLYFLAWGAGYFLGPLLAGIFGKHVGMEICFQLYGCLLLLETFLMFIGKNDCHRS